MKLATKYREAEKGVTKKIESLLIEIRAGGLTSTEGKKEGHTEGKKDKSEDTGGFLGFMKGGETEGKKEDGEDKAGFLGFIKGMENPMGDSLKMVIIDRRIS